MKIGEVKQKVCRRWGGANTKFFQQIFFLIFQFQKIWQALKPSLPYGQYLIKALVTIQIYIFIQMMILFFIIYTNDDFIFYNWLVISYIIFMDCRIILINFRKFVLFFFSFYLFFNLLYLLYSSKNQSYQILNLFLQQFLDQF